MSKAFALGLVLTIVAGVAASDAKRKPRPIRIVEPGALAFDYRGGLMVADRRLNRVVRIDLRTGKRRVAVTGLRDIVGLAYDDLRRLYVAAGDLEGPTSVLEALRSARILHDAVQRHELRYDDPSHLILLLALSGRRYHNQPDG